jgi:hypothetical protein
MQISDNKFYLKANATKFCLSSNATFVAFTLEIFYAKIHIEKLFTNPFQGDIL